MISPAFVRSSRRGSAKGDLFTSVSVAAVLFFLLSSSMMSGVTDSLMRDSSLMIQSRPVITREALDTIAEDNKISIVGTGSSMAFKGLDGKCVGNLLQEEAIVYNIAQLNSYPWTDMIHIPRLIQSNPEIVLIEIGPNILINISTEKGNENAKFRYKIDTSQQNSDDMGDWIELIDPALEQYIATNTYQRMEFRQEYVPESIEEHLIRLFYNESNAREEWTYGWTPEPNSEDWVEYLQLPVFPPDRYGFDGMNETERQEYNLTKMGGSAGYKPLMESYAFVTLEYEITTLVENGIQVIIIGFPHHPDSINAVPNGKWDSVNETMEYFSRLDGVTIFNEIWESGWEDEHFYDRNHLDDEGRIEFCQRLAPIIDQVLNE